MNSIRAAVAVALSLGTPALAGPDATTQWLINDPLTMMDFGLYRIELQLQTPTLIGRTPGGSAVFDWDGNRILIRKFLFVDEGEDAERLCSEWISDVRVQAGVSLDDGTAYIGHSIFAEFFNHLAFSRTSAPPDWQAKLDKLMELRCETAGKGGAVKLVAPLVGKSYSIEKLTNSPTP